MNYPDLDPVALQLGPLALRWYGLMYLFGFAAFLLLGNWRARDQQSGWSPEQVWDLMFYGVFGVVVGGRLGFALFYGWETFLRDPLWVIRLWEGGMSFHGGLLGVLAATAIYAVKKKRAFLSVTDFAAPLVPLGLGFGRLGNFVNAELPGRVTDLPLGVHFPCDAVRGLSVSCYGQFEAVARHVSSLYQAATEGPVLFALLWWYARKPRAAGQVSGLFLLGYGGLRLATEFVREPDPDKGFVAFGWLTMGQALSLPMAVLGGALLCSAALRERLARFPSQSAAPAAARRGGS